MARRYLELSDEITDLDELINPLVEALAPQLLTRVGIGVEIAGLSKDRDDYLQKQAEAQFAVAEDELLDAVRKVLARHDIKWG